MPNHDHSKCSPGPDGCVLDKTKPEIPTSGLLSAAEKIVDERMSKYGVPTESWTRIGRMWGARLNVPDIPAEVCLKMMCDVKSIRETYEHNDDNWVDDVGYTDCAHRVLTAKLKEKEKEDEVSRLSAMEVGGEIKTDDQPYRPLSRH